MNRSKSKIVCKLTDRQCKSINRGEFIKYRSVISRFADGGIVTLNGVVNNDPNFDPLLGDWEILKTRTHLTGEPAAGSVVYLENITLSEFFEVIIWRGCISDRVSLNRGICHSSATDAVKSCQKRHNIK